MIFSSHLLVAAQHCLVKILLALLREVAELQFTASIVQKLLISTQPDVSKSAGPMMFRKIKIIIPAPYMLSRKIDTGS